MKTKEILGNKKYSYVALGVAAVFFVVMGFAKMPHNSAEAQTNSAAPVIGIQASQGSGGGTGGCNVNLTNVAYSTDPNAYAGSSDYNGSPYGNTDCARIWLSGQGPFTQDFQIGVRMQNPKLSGGWGPWGWTSWASDIATGAASAGWSPWVGAIQNVGSDPGHGMYQVAVNTRALPADGDIISASEVGLQEGDGNTVMTEPYYCDQNISGQFAQVYSAGGWSTGGKGSTGASGFSGVGDVADCTRLFLGQTFITGAMETDNNIPSSFTASEKKTTDTTGNPLSITMKNIGTTPWMLTFAESNPGVPTGTCAAGSDQPPSDSTVYPSQRNLPTTRCSVSVDLTGTNYLLAHAASSFSEAPEEIPLVYKGVTKTTIYTPAYSTDVTVPCTTMPGAENTSGRNGILSFISAAHAIAVTTPSNPGECTATRSTPEKWMVSYSGGGYQAQVAAGSSVTYFMDSLTAPSAAGAYTEKWQMETGQGTGAFGSIFKKQITVGGKTTPPAQTAGTISVVSVNAGLPAQTSGNVPAAWTFFAPPGNTICGGAAAPCPTGKDAQYQSQPFGTYTITNEQAADPSLYSLKGVIKNGAIAKNGGTPLDSLFALSKNLLFGVAEAYVPYGCFGNDPSACSSSSSYANISSLDIQSDPNNVLDQGNFEILWNPIPAMDVAPLSIDLDPSGTTSGTVTITNTGAEGSALAWTANTTYTAGGAAGWLTPETSNGTVTNAAGQSGSSGNTGNVTFAISPSAAGMASGTYTADVHFVGTSPTNNCLVNCGTQDVVITLTVGGGTSCTGSGCSGTPTSTNPTSTEPTNPTSTGPTNPTSTSPVDQPSCTLSAVPSSIIVPQPATLKYSCVKVSSCTLSGGGFGTSSIVSVAGDNTAKGSTTDAPTANTFYTISCYGTGSYSSATATAQVQVSVTNPGRNETNP